MKLCFFILNFLAVCRLCHSHVRKDTCTRLSLLFRTILQATKSWSGPGNEATFNVNIQESELKVGGGGWGGGGGALFSGGSIA